MCYLCFYPFSHVFSSTIYIIFFVLLLFAVNAEKLFDIEVTDYSRFLGVKDDFERMLIIYKLYQAQKIARETWAKTLWVNLNTQALTDGIDNFIKDYRKLSKVVRQMPIALVLETIMKQFKNVVPLMANLKHEALRERHWKMLMTKTNNVFDMSPDRFTLENMFSMELHKYQEIVEEIVLNAIKELAIERGVKEIAELWQTINFTVIKHTMGVSQDDRGYVGVIKIVVNFNLMFICPLCFFFCCLWLK